MRENIFVSVSLVNRIKNSQKKDLSQHAVLAPIFLFQLKKTHKLKSMWKLSQPVGKDKLRWNTAKWQCSSRSVTHLICTHCLQADNTITFQMANNKVWQLVCFCITSFRDRDYSIQRSVWWWLPTTTPGIPPVGESIGNNVRI